MDGPLQTRELLYFVAVAEELHFGRAAERLAISQPPLSRAIAQLELRIGVQLIRRSSRRVTLTPAGEVFLTECRTALDAINTAAQRARQAAGTVRLSLAVRPGIGTALVADLLAAYHDRGGGELDLSFTRDQAAAVRNGSAHAAVVCEGENLDGLRTIPLAEERPVALVHAGHRLGSRAYLTIADLQAERTFSEQDPDVGLDEMIDLVALRRLVVVVGDGITTRLGSTVTAVPVIDMAGSNLVLAWPRALESLELGKLIDAAASIDRARWSSRRTA